MALCGQPWWIDTVTPAMCEPRPATRRAVSAVWGGTQIRVDGDTIELHGRRFSGGNPLLALHGVLGFWPWAAARLPSGARGGPVALHDRGEALLVHMGFGHYVVVSVSQSAAAYWFRLQAGEPRIRHAYYEASCRRRWHGIGPIVASSDTYRYVLDPPRLLRRRRRKEDGGWLGNEEEEEEVEHTAEMARLAPGSVWGRGDLRAQQRRRRAATVVRIMRTTALDDDCLRHVVSRMQ